MNLNQSKLRTAVRFALCFGATGVLAGPALAQDDTATLERIEVTGSRIKRVDAETSQPVFSLSREAIQAQGLTSVGDVIQNITANGSTLNTTFNNGGNGETRVSLRNLGSNRTLVLVNGRRWIGGTGLGGAVDLNTIPTAAVERIEVLKDGASVIYGSDAIAGVVNVILRSDFDGAEANGFYGQYDEGDGERYSADFTVGSTGDRFSGMMGVGYVNEKPVMAGDRAISAIPTANTTPFFGASSTTPNGRFACLNAAGTATTNCGGGLGFADFFTNSGPNTARRPYVAADNYNFAPDNYLVTPQERVSFFGRGHVDITDSIRFNVAATYNERRSEQLLAAMPVVLGRATTSPLAAQVRISRNNIYNTTGADIDWIQRRVTETGGRSFNQDVDTFGFNGYFEGNFELGSRYFNWDAGYFYGKNEQNDITFGLFNVAALRDALGPSEIRNGVPVCVTAPGGSVIPGCVPMNFLGGAGTITPAMLAYSSFIAKDALGYEMKNYFANISGDVFELPAGTVQFAAGVEKRFEEGFDQPDALIATGNTTGNARTPTAGGYDLEEAYVEFQVPVLNGVAFAEELDFSVATRYSDYSNFGDTTNSKFGFRWKPVGDLLVRGNYSEGFRAPSILELFRGVADSFPSLTDPCANSVAGGTANPYSQLNADQRARCSAQGVAAGGYAQANSQIRISIGGNPNLQPETSVTKTLGLVYSSSHVEGLDVSLDWWQIKLDDAIVSRSGQFIVDSCIRDGNAGACSLFTRDATGQIATLLSAGLNDASALVEGYDLTVGYRLPFEDWGRFSFVWDSTYLARNESNNDGDNVAGEYFDRNNNWRIRSNLLTRWEMGDFGATLYTRFYSKQDETCPAIIAGSAQFRDLCSDPTRFVNNAAGRPTFAPQNRIGGTTYHDVTVYWNSPWNSKITLGVNNAFDKAPPFAYSAFANSFDPQYEIPGRMYYLSYNQRF